jgi:hypothetical protein
VAGLRAATITSQLQQHSALAEYPDPSHRVSGDLRLLDVVALGILALQIGTADALPDVLRLGEPLVAVQTTISAAIRPSPLCSARCAATLISR